MSSALLDLGSRYPKLRRALIRLWRNVWRMRRATLARAVVAIRDDSGRVLVLKQRDRVLLPTLALNAWDSVGAQVEPVLQALCRPRRVALVAIDGRVDAGGITFLYVATHSGGPSEGLGPPEDFEWLEPNAALHRLSEADRGFLRFSASDPSQRRRDAKRCDAQ